MNFDQVKRHNRKLGLLAADLVVVRFRFNLNQVITEVRDEIEPLLKSSGFFDGAPFEWITLCFRIGKQNEVEPHFGPVNHQYGDLPLSIEVNASELLLGADQAKHRLREATLKVLLHVSQRFGLSMPTIEE